MIMKKSVKILMIVIWDEVKVLTFILEGLFNLLYKKN